MNAQRRCMVPLAAVALGGMLAGCNVPDIDPPAGEVPIMTIVAHGVQIHECRASSAEPPAWTLVAPEADLFDLYGRRIGHHGAGPSWHHEDGSGFVGTVRARLTSPAPRSVPWLLLSASPRSAEGKFSRVSSVQRLNTVGGLPPVAGCSTSTLGQRVHMAYRAHYVLHERASARVAKNVGLPSAR